MVSKPAAGIDFSSSSSSDEGEQFLSTKAIGLGNSRAAGKGLPGRHRGFPLVEVSMATRLLLLTWARWGRNAWRIKEEDRIKALQHVRYPRSQRPAPPVISPQPTPQSTPRGSSNVTVGQGTLEILSLPTARRRAGGLCGTHRSRDGSSVGDAGSPSRAAPLLFEELMQDQRESMNAQGARLRLTQQLGPSAAQAKSTGTPGFGVDTPNFVGTKPATVEASVASSGIASPTNRGQMSPWILEAEALLNGEEDEVDGSGPAVAWGISPCELSSIEALPQVPEAAMLSVKVRPTSPAATACSGRTAATAPRAGNLDLEPREEEAAAIEDEDELAQVELFAPRAPAAMAQRTSAPLPAPGRAAGSSSAGALTNEGHPPSCPVAYAYSPGDLVSYWSASHGAWMPARIVERKSQSVYLVDKQLRGCLSKVRAADLVSEAEERLDPVLRAFATLETELAQSRNGKSRSPRSGMGSPGSSTKASTCLPSPPAVQHRGRIVRDDFSDDSD